MSALVAFSRSMSGIGVGPSESERTGEQESTCEKDCLCTFF